MKRMALALSVGALGILGCAASQNASVPTTIISKSGKSQRVFDGAAFCAANRNAQSIDTTGLALDRRNQEQRTASGSPRTLFPIKFHDGGTFEVTCSVTRDGRVNYAQVVPGAPLSDNDIGSLKASGYCGTGTSD